MFANFGSRIAAMSFVCCIMLETTPFCTLCNYLTDDCYRLADALFESNWIEQDERYKKIVLQFLQTLQKPIVFMAGNIFSISVATNLTVSPSIFTLPTLYSWLEYFFLIFISFIGHQIFILCFYAG